MHNTAHGKFGFSACLAVPSRLFFGSIVVGAEVRLMTCLHVNLRQEGELRRWVCVRRYSYPVIYFIHRLRQIPVSLALIEGRLVRA